MTIDIEAEVTVAGLDMAARLFREKTIHEVRRADSIGRDFIINEALVTLILGRRPLKT